MQRDDDQVLRPGALDSYTGGDASVTFDVYALAQQSFREDAAVLRQALADGDAQTAGTTAHRIKGASKMLGAALQARAARRVEMACRAGALAQARDALLEFEREHARLCSHLTALLGSSTRG